MTGPASPLLSVRFPTHTSKSVNYYPLAFPFKAGNTVVRPDSPEPSDRDRPLHGFQNEWVMTAVGNRGVFGELRGGGELGKNISKQALVVCSVKVAHFHKFILMVFTNEIIYVLL